MPRRPKARSAGATSGAPRGAKTAAVKAALKAHPGKQPREIAELLKAEGWDVKAAHVSVVKSNMLRNRAKTTAPARASKAAPAARKDAISLEMLQKAKSLASQLGGIKQAKAAIDALAQLID